MANVEAFYYVDIAQMDHFYPLGRVGGFQYLDVDRADFSRASFVAKTRMAAIWASLHPFGRIRCVVASASYSIADHQGCGTYEEYCKVEGVSVGNPALVLTCL